MKKNVLISIRGVQKVEDDKDVVEVLTTGSFYRRGGSYYISYDETEATGFEGSHTVLQVENGSRVTMRRSGSVRSQLIVEQGVRHQCSYDMSEGALTIGVCGGKVNSSLTDEGGDIRFNYSLDINTSLASENEIAIHVREC